MKARRASGATHSFRLTRRAADIVDRLQYPRKLGGKSALISEAICYYFGGDDDGNTVHELRERVQWWMKHCDEITLAKSTPQVGVWSIIRTTIRRWIGRN